MKTTDVHRLVIVSLRATIACGAILLSGSMAVAQSVPHEEIWLLVSDTQGGGTPGHITMIYSDTPRQFIESHPISGLGSGEELLGMDYWAGQLYAVGSGSRFYTLDPHSGLATLVGNFGSNVDFLLTSQRIGFDNEPDGARIVNTQGQNLLISRTTGLGISHGPNPTNPVSALAYDYASGTLYGIYYFATLGTFDAATGAFSRIGPLVKPDEFSTLNGLDVSPDSGFLYLASGDRDPQANLYYLDKSTGRSTLIGLIGEVGENYLFTGLTVRSTNPPVNLIPPSLTIQASRNPIEISWPTDHLGWRLEAQTNGLNPGMGANWHTVPGSLVTNRVVLPITSNSAFFFRLTYP